MTPTTTKPYLHEFYVTRKCTKYEYFTVKAESMEDAKYEAEHGYDYYDFDWEEAVSYTHLTLPTKRIV